MSSRVFIILTAGILALMVPTVAGAQGVAFAIADGPYPQAMLQQLSLETGELEVIGEIGYPVTHISIDSAEGLYGVDADNDQLLRIDMRSGAGAPVGILGASVYEVTGLSFDRDDRLWMAARDDDSGPSLYEIDVTSGQATWVSAVDEALLGSMAARDGEMYMAGWILSAVDTTSGAVTPVPGSDFGIWSSRATDFDAEGRLWSLMLCGPCATPGDVLVMSEIDTVTGTPVEFGPAEPHGTWAVAILRSGLFFDGFEAGDTSGWAAVSP